jgi:hypothetical protein
LAPERGHPFLNACRTKGKWIYWSISQVPRAQSHNVRTTGKALQGDGFRQLTQASGVVTHYCPARSRQIAGKRFEMLEFSLSRLFLG